MKSVIQFFIHSFHVFTLVYDQEKSKNNISDKSNEHFLFTSIQISFNPLQQIYTAFNV